MREGILDLMVHLLNVYKDNSSSGKANALLG